MREIKREKEVSVQGQPPHPAHRTAQQSYTHLTSSPLLTPTTHTNPALLHLNLITATALYCIHAPFSFHFTCVCALSIRVVSVVHTVIILACFFGFLNFVDFRLFFIFYRHQPSQECSEIEKPGSVCSARFVCRFLFDQIFKVTFICYV